MACGGGNRGKRYIRTPQCAFPNDGVARELIVEFADLFVKSESGTSRIHRVYRRPYVRIRCRAITLSSKA